MMISISVSVLLISLAVAFLLGLLSPLFLLLYMVWKAKPRGTVR